MNFFSLFFSIIVALILYSHAIAEIKVIEADSSYVIGDNDSKVDARRIATQEAKRKALEQAGTFVASLTQVKEYRLSKDEVTAYTAGIVEAETISDETRGSLQHPEAYIRIRCRIDTDVLVQQIARYQENQELRDQLQASAKEQEALRRERDTLAGQLAAEKDKTKTAETRKKLGSVLTREENIDATNRVWARVAPQMDFYGSSEINKEVRLGDLQDSAVVLVKAVEDNPSNQQARILLASVYEQQNDRPAAEQQLRSALELDRNNTLLRLRLGIVLREQGKFHEALQEFRAIEQKRPYHPQMLFQTGLTHLAMKNCRLAGAYMKRFLLFTKKSRSPQIEKVKPRAKEILDRCGEPKPEKRSGRKPRR
ncbi:MAG: tetratricopeptide repeat protein [Nitrospirota bacterium]|nr:tetratricopeptide repeat protein [Nitrospirota bacterium]